MPVSGYKIHCGFDILFRRPEECIYGPDGGRLQYLGVAAAILCFTQPKADPTASATGVTASSTRSLTFSGAYLLYKSAPIPAHIMKLNITRKSTEPLPRPGFLDWFSFSWRTRCGEKFNTLFKFSGHSDKTTALCIVIMLRIFLLYIFSIFYYIKIQALREPCVYKLLEFLHLMLFGIFLKFRALLCVWKYPPSNCRTGIPPFFPGVHAKSDPVGWLAAVICKYWNLQPWLVLEIPAMKLPSIALGFELAWQRNQTVCYC